MATGRVPTTANSPLTAKGDLFGYSTTQARVAVGNDGETLVADSSTSTGLRYQGSMAAGKNFVINGNFDVWQRGTTFTNSVVGTYTVDRWQILDGTQTATISQQTTGAPVGSRYIMRNAYNSAGSYGNIAQGIETNNVSQLWGRTVTFSYKIRRNATLATDMNIVVAKSATVDASYGATWTSIGSTTIPNASIPTGTTSADWYTASLTVAIPNDGTANSIRVAITHQATSPSGAYWELSQAQLELGSVATAFSRAGGTIQGELAACQRYYYRNANGNAYQEFGLGITPDPNFAEFTINFPVTMRTTITSVDSASLAVSDGSVGFNGGTITLPSGQQGTNFACVRYTHTSAALTQYRPYRLEAQNSTSAFLGFSAEL
jgi:hypothetical protein